ncbi:MAG: ABC transporter substrate-binding protein [Pseudomonadota bacterium]
MAGRQVHRRSFGCAPLAPGWGSAYRDGIVITRTLSCLCLLAACTLPAACVPAVPQHDATAPAAPPPDAPPSDASPPDRPRPSFVSLNPCLDEILVEIAAPEQILALSHYSRQPGGSRMDPGVAARFAATGGTAEEVIALAPDIVLASSFIAPSTKSALERAGLRVESFASPRSIAESAQQVARIGEIGGRRGPAQALASAIMTLPRSRSRGRRGGPSALLWQPGQIVAGQQTIINELIREAGFASYAAERALEQADYIALETLLSDPPDLLLIAGDSIGQRHRALRALAGTRVEMFEPTLLYCGGPTVIAARARLRDARKTYSAHAP